jgi:cobalt-zinc-cadmium efflux system outer membrane protein
VHRADAFVRDAERQVTGDALRAFSDVRVGQERVALAREVVALTTEVRDTAVKLFDAGAVPELDTFRADVELEKSRNRQVTEERNLTTAQRELALVLGRAADEAIRAEGPLIFPVPPGDLAALQRAAWERRPDLAVARAAVRVADAELRLVDAERLFPEVKVGLKYDEARDFDTVNRTGLLTLSVPLPLLNRRQGDMVRAQAELRKQEAQVALVQRRIEKEVATAYQQVAASARVTEAYVSRILPDQDRNFRLLREGYNLGEFRITDVFVGQREFIDAREAYLNAAAELNAATAELYRALNLRP